MMACVYGNRLTEDSVKMNGLQRRLHDYTTPRCSVAAIHDERIYRGLGGQHSHDDLA